MHGQGMRVIAIILIFLVKILCYLCHSSDDNQLAEFKNGKVTSTSQSRLLSDETKIISDTVKKIGTTRDGHVEEVIQKRITRLVQIGNVIKIIIV